MKDMIVNFFRKNMSTPLMKRKDAFFDMLFSYWNFLYKNFFDKVFFCIAGIFVFASIYEFTMRYLIPFYTFQRVAFLFLVLTLLYIIKKSFERDRKVQRLLTLLQQKSASLFYLTFSVFTVFLILSINFIITPEFLRFIFVLLLLNYAIFKYYGNSIEFQKISFNAFSYDALKLYILFFCITIFTLTPFVNATYLYNNRALFFPVLILIDTILLTYLMYEVKFLNQFIPRKYRKT